MKQLDFFSQLWDRFVRQPRQNIPTVTRARPVTATALPKAGQTFPQAEGPRPPMSSELQLPELAAEARQILRRLGCAPLAERLVVRWNPRMRSTAGTAHWGRSLISLNPQLCRFGAEEVRRTLLHELAHLLAQYRAGKRRIAPHGAEWQRACAEVGLPGEARCHTLPLERRPYARPYHYECPACGVRVERVRPIRRRLACLACCRKHNRGQYDDRFRFVRVPPAAT